MQTLLPELIVGITSLVILVIDLFTSERQKGSLAFLSILGMGAAMTSLVFLFPLTHDALGGRFLVTPIAAWFKLLFLMGGIFTVAFAWTTQRHERLAAGGEFFAILLLTQVGMMLLISARELITLYISLELSTIPLFALAAWKRGDTLSGEAGLKYVIYGALASALLLYGLGLVYGISGQFDLSLIRENITSSPTLWLAMALIFAGIGFKLTLTPFHMWAADVYEGAPTAVTAYLSVASKAAGLAFMFQLFIGLFGKELSHWSWLFAIIAAVTMTLGNLVAIVQNNIKRFMAFSSISQAGNLILGFLLPNTEGSTAMLFYLLVYVFTNMAVFGVIICYSDATGRTQIDDYRGLSRTNPLFALTMTIGLFGLAGIPPLAGFVGKFFLFKIAAQAGMYWLVALAAINATVSLYYYLRIVRAMYIVPPDPSDTPISIPVPMTVTLLIAALGSILLGIVPIFYDCIASAAAAAR